MANGGINGELDRVSPSTEYIPFFLGKEGVSKVVTGLLIVLDGIWPRDKGFAALREGAL
jgi:hypothetical protein